MRGEQVHLRILERSDIETTTRWMNSDSIGEIMGYLPIMSLEQQYEWYEKVKNDRSRHVFTIRLNRDDRHIGNVALGNIDHVHRHAMFSIFIAVEDDRAKGLGLEATRLCLGFAFDRLNLNKVHLRVSPSSPKAVRLYEKIGFVKEGVMRQHYFTNGRYEDKLIYSILREEFNQGRPRHAP